MAIAISLQHYLSSVGVEFDAIPHKKADRAKLAARACRISEECVAKGVIIKSEKDYLLAVLPASREVALRGLVALLGQPIRLATEQEFASLFKDCEIGAVPPVGKAYGLRTVVDRQLLDEEDVYFEGGDHRTMVHMSGNEFRKLMHRVPHRHLSREPRTPGTRSEMRAVPYWGA